MAEYFPDTGAAQVQFKSLVSGNWLPIRTADLLFPTEAKRRMAELKAANPHMEYRIV